MARGKQHVGLGKGLGDLFARTDEETSGDASTPSDRLRDGLGDGGFAVTGWG